MENKIVEQIHQRELKEKFNATFATLAIRHLRLQGVKITEDDYDLTQVDIPELLDGRKIGPGFAKIAMGYANQTKDSDLVAHSQARFIGTMPTAIDAIRTFGNKEHVENGAQRDRMLNGIQDYRLAIRALANNVSTMNFETFGDITSEVAGLYRPHDNTAPFVGSSKNFLNIARREHGIEAVLFSLDQVEEHEYRAERGTQQLKYDVNLVDQRRALLFVCPTPDAANKRRSDVKAHFGQVPAGYTFFPAPLAPGHFSREHPLRLTESSVKSLREPLAEALDLSAA